MYKGKSLVTVILDNAVAMFPVDSERYELAAAVEALCGSGYINQGLSSYTHDDDRINDWLHSVEEQAWRASTFWRTLPIQGSDADPAPLEVDLARRFESSLPGHLPWRWVREQCSEGASPDFGRRLLWQIIHIEMWRSGHFFPLERYSRLPLQVEEWLDCYGV